MTSMTSPTTDVLRLPWSEAKEAIGWRQGEHITIVGPTGQGKTTMALDLLLERAYPLVFATKTKDDTLSKWARAHRFPISRTWPLPTTRGILWPRPPGHSLFREQAKVFNTAFSSVYEQGGYAVLIDELFYMTKKLGMADWLETLWTQGRSHGISVIGCVQRPTHIPLLAYDQATHIVMFRDADEVNIKRLGGLGHWNRNQIMQAVGRLPKYEAIVLNTREGQMIQTRMEV